MHDRIDVTLLYLCNNEGVGRRPCL